MRTWIVAIAMACASQVLAQTPEQIAEQAFARGNTAYNLGRWGEAVAHFTQAYEAVPRPELLYNIAQAHRQDANCRQALHFYKRFLSLKEQDRSAPLSRRKRAEVTTFIAQLAECAAKAERSIAIKPDTLDPPEHAPVPASPASTAPRAPAAPPAAPTAPTAMRTDPPPMPPSPPPPPATEVARMADAERVRAAEPGVSRDDTAHEQAADDAVPRDDPEHVIAARALAGLALLSAGDLDIPPQPSFGVVGGHPLKLGDATVEVGAGLSYTPLPYGVMGTSHRGSLVGFRAVGSTVWPIRPRLALRVDAGIGVVALRGLAMGNPWTEGAVAGTFALFHLRVGAAAEVALTRSLALVIAPLDVAWSPGADGLAADSIRSLEILVGIGGRR